MQAISYFNTVAPLTNRETDQLFLFFSSRALLFNMQRPLPTLHSYAYRGSAPRYSTVSLRSFSVGCLGYTHLFFFSRTIRRGRSKYVKREWCQGAAPKRFFLIIISPPPKYNTPLSEENIYRTTRPSESRALCAFGTYTHPPEVDILP